MITKILLADSSEEFRLLLRHTLEDTGEFQIVGDTGDGEAAWELIQQTQPDIVVMDVILPGLDGVSLLQRMPKNVKTIVLSAFCSQNMVQEVMRLGAWYFIPKPAHMDSLLERIREAAVPENGALALPTLEADVTAIIHEVGVPAHIKGYQYVREAIIIAVQDMDVINAVTKVLPGGSQAVPYHALPRRACHPPRHRGGMGPGRSGNAAGLFRLHRQQRQGQAHQLRVHCHDRGSHPPSQEESGSPEISKKE